MFTGNRSTPDLDRALHEIRFEPDPAFAVQLERQLQAMLLAKKPVSISPDHRSVTSIPAEHFVPPAASDDFSQNRTSHLLEALGFGILVLLVLVLIGLFAPHPSDVPIAPPREPEIREIGVPIAQSPQPIAPEIAIPTVPSREPITPENANRLIQLGLLGYGRAIDVAWSPDGKMLAVGTSAGIVLYYASDLDAEPQWYEISVGYVNDLAFSPDGTLLAAAGKKGFIVWSVTQGREQAVLETKTETLSAAFSPDGSMLASGAADGTVRGWDVESGELVIQFYMGRPSVTDVAFSPDGRILAALARGRRDGVLRLWDVKTAGFVTELWSHTGSLAGLAFSPDGETLSTGSRSSNRVKLWDVGTGNLLTEMPGHIGDVVSVAFSPDGTLLASSAGWEEVGVRLWDMKTHEQVALLEGCAREAHNGEIGVVAFSPDGSMLASTCSGSGVMIWDIPGGQPLQLSRGYSGRVGDIAFSPSGAFLAAGYWRDLVDPSGDLRLWNLESGQEQTRLQGHTTTVSSVAFSPDGSLLASGSHDATVRIWDVVTGTTRLIVEGQSDRPPGGYSYWADGEGDVSGSIFWDTAAVWSLAFSPDGKSIAVGRGDPWVGPGFLELVDVAAGKLLSNLKLSTPPLCCDMVTVFDLAFSPDGSLLVTANGDGSVTLWDTAKGEEQASLLDWGDGWFDVGVAFSPDGRTVAVGGSQSACGGWSACGPSRGLILLWDVVNEEQVALWETNSGKVAFSPDGKLLASANEGEPGSLLLWDTSTGQVAAALETPGSSTLEFSADGSMLAVSNSDGTVRLWGVPPE